MKNNLTFSASAETQKTLNNFSEYGFKSKSHFIEGALSAFVEGRVKNDAEVRDLVAKYVDNAIREKLSNFFHEYYARMKGEVTEDVKAALDPVRFGEYEITQEEAALAVPMPSTPPSDDGWRKSFS